MKPNSKSKRSIRGFSRHMFMANRVRTLKQPRFELDILSGLGQACQKDELRIVYQPIISFRSNKPVYFEALVRWHHPTAGLINPADFIPYAETNGLIKDIGEWVIKNSCRQLKEWQDRFPGDPAIAVSVNISPRQLEDHDLIRVVENTLIEVQPAKGSMIFEITESSIIRNVDMALDVLNSLKSLGVIISLDDFGTGYSTVKVLRRFPFDSIKLDRSYIDRMFNSKKDLEYISKSFELGLKLNLEVIAEGIETVHQQNALKEMRCRLGQGFLYSKPVISNMVDQMLLNGIQ